MKKSILIPFLFIGLLAFASCKGTSENKTTAGADTVQTEKPQPGTIHLTRAEFLKKVADYENHSKEWKYLGDKPAIVDFYADWCGPCQMLAPVLHELADEVGSKAAFYSIDVDENRQLATEYGISSIPCLVVLKNGQESARSVGFLPKQALQDMLDKYI